MSFTYNDYWKNFRNTTGKQYFMDYNSECRSNMAFINKSIMSVMHASINSCMFCFFLLHGLSCHTSTKQKLNSILKLFSQWWNENYKCS